MVPSPSQLDKEELLSPEAIKLSQMLKREPAKLMTSNTVSKSSLQATSSPSPSTASSCTLPGGRSLHIPESVKFIRLTWVDFTNNLSNCMIPIKRFLSTLETPSKGGLSLPTALFYLLPDGVTPGYSSSGEWRYVPDVSSLKVCGVDEGRYASVMGYFGDEDGKGSCPYCPRGILRRIIEYVM